jgi:hypothetical protein
MAKERIRDKNVEDRVKKEFNYRCAICGHDNPQIHHIDNCPSNNDPSNLIPLCPNHHLIDQHNPTQTYIPDIIKLFRKYKDPAILTPQFFPLFLRLRFLTEVEQLEDDFLLLYRKAQVLARFLMALEMGTIYENEVFELITIPSDNRDFVENNLDPDLGEKIKKHHIELARMYKETIIINRDRVTDLIIEMLRYQNWKFDNNL